MLTTQDFAGTPDTQPEVQVGIRVTRAFCVSGMAQRIGTTLTVPVSLARELVAAHKAQLLGSPEGVE